MKLNFQVVWQNTEYNIGNGLNINDGKFIAPNDGIYYFYSQARTSGSSAAYIEFYLNGSQKSFAKRDEDGETDFVTLSSQYMLHKGDSVWVYFTGYFDNPIYAPYAFFEGHLIRKINSS